MVNRDHLASDAPIIHREVVDEHMGDTYTLRWKKEPGVDSHTDDITTDTDRIIESKLHQRLKVRFGNKIGFVGEETGEHAEPDQERWVADPVDGTTVRLIGGNLWSSVLALIDPVTQNISFVSVYQPTAHTQYLFVDGKGSWKETVVHEVGRRPRRQSTWMYGEDSSALGELRGCAYIPARYNDNAPGMDDSLESIFRYIHHPDIKDGRNYKIADVRPGSGSASLMACHVAEGRIHFQILYQQGAYDLLGFKITEGADCPASAGLESHDEGEINNITTVGLQRVNGAVYNKETTKRLVNTLLLHPEASTVDELTALME